MIPLLKTKAYKVLIIAFLSLTSIVLISQLPYIKFDYNLQNLFPAEDPDLQFYLEHKEIFGYDNDYLLIGIKNKGSLLDTAFLQKVNQLTKQLSAFQSIEKVYSPTKLKIVLSTPTGLIGVPLLHISNPEKLKSDSLKIHKNKFYKAFFNFEKNALKVGIKHAHLERKDQSDKLVSKIEHSISLVGFEDYYLAGKAKAQKVFIGLLESEFALFLAIGLVIILTFLIFVFRNWRYVLIPFIIIGLCISWTIGIMIMSGSSFTIITSLIPTILLIIGTSDVIHFFSANFNDNEKEFSEVMVSTFLTSITTAIGFLSLLFINNQLIQKMGFFTALGVLIAYLITLLVVSLTINPLKKVKPIAWTAFNFGILLVWCVRFKKWIVVTFIVITVIAINGVLNIQFDAYLIEDLPGNNKVKQDFMFFDEAFGGSKPWEMAIWSRDSGDVYNLSDIRALKSIHQFLSSKGFSNIISPYTAYRIAYEAKNITNDFDINKGNFRSLTRTVRKIGRYGIIPEITNPSNNYARVTAFIPEWGSKKTIYMNEKIKQFIQSNCPQLNFRITGTTLLIDKTHHMLSSDLINGLIVAIILVGLIGIFVFKTWKAFIILLIPNVLPLLIIASVMGFMGISIQLTTAIIFATSFGIAVDDTIHFCSKFFIKRNKGMSTIWSLKASLQSTGKAMTLTTIILMFGFSVFCFSTFGATFYVGLFISLTLLIALLIDLTLLPLLILLLFPNHSK
ncbi:MAG TPA: RND family transporter [Cyclobacteriaceae bacterium]